MIRLPFRFRNKKNKNTDQDFTNVIINETSNFSVVEAYKTTRTNIIYALAGVPGCKKILFTSAEPADGKSTTCMNTAITFALTGEKVLLIDADLRKPSVHTELNLPNRVGLSTYLGEIAEIDDIIQHSDEHKIDCITSGHIPPNPVELLSSPKMKAFIDEVSKFYDYIFFDTPPVNVVSDAIILSKHTTGVILVVRENYTEHEAIEKAISGFKFANTKLLGFVLNSLDNTGAYYKRSFGDKKKYAYSSVFGKARTNKKEK